MDEGPNSRELVPAKPPVIVARERAGADEESRGVASGISKRRKLLALAIAALSDAVSMSLTLPAPPLQWAVDCLTAVALFAVLGFRWPLLPVLLIEAVPVAAAFPTWLLAVGVLVGVTPTK